MNLRDGLLALMRCNRTPSRGCFVFRCRSSIYKGIIYQGIAIFVLLCSCYFSSVAYAALNLELTEGKNAALPIAVLPFQGQSVNRSQSSRSATFNNSNNNVAYIVKNDLQNSGQFLPLSWSSLGGYQAASTTASNFNKAYWQRRRVDDVVLGQVQKLNNHRSKISFSLMNVYAAENNKAQARGATAALQGSLLHKSFEVADNQLRQGAHHISDQVYQTLLGIPGVFSTRISYVNWYIAKRYDPQTKKLLPKYFWALQVADADGYNPQTVLRSPWPIMSPAWSPDGKKLAYVSFENNQARIYLQDISSGARQVLSDASGINGAPAFSPDGRQLAIVLSISGHSKIYRLALASGKLAPLLPGQAKLPGIDTEPTWAPDGKSIVFTSDRGGSPQLYQYFLNPKDAPSKQPIRLTFNGNYNAHGVFLPSGKGLVLMHRDRGSSSFNIAKLDLASNQLTDLTNDIASEAPSVAPNGQMVIYSTQYGGKQLLAIVSINGDVKLRLPMRSNTDMQGVKVEVKNPAWSPFLH